MDVAVERLVDGLGFTWENMWFRREDDRLLCAVFSPWRDPGLSEPEARCLLAGAHEALAHLLSCSAALTANCLSSARPSRRSVMSRLT
jgi:hypothetical protein